MGRSYTEKIEALKEKMLNKIDIYKATCRMRIEKSNFEESEYIEKYNYLILLENYLKSSNPFNEKLLNKNIQIDDVKLNKLLSNNYDPVWNYLELMSIKCSHVDMINIFNRELFNIKDMSDANKGLRDKGEKHE